MKRVICFSIGVLIFSVFFMSAQEKISAETQSIVEKTEASKGKIIKNEEFSRIYYTGWSSTFHIKPSVITDVQSGLKIAYIALSAKVSTGTYQSIIDFEEIPALIDAIESIISSQTGIVPTAFTSVSFRTNDDIEIGVFYDVYSKEKKNDWQMYITQHRYLSKPRAVVYLDEMKKFLEDLKSAKTLLEEKLK